MSIIGKTNLKKQKKSGIIGKFYTVIDNSGCINLETKSHAYLVKCDAYYDTTHDGREYLAEYIIISEPYDEDLDFCSEKMTRTYINVVSTLTGIQYRVLFCEGSVYKKRLKDE